MSGFRISVIVATLAAIVGLATAGYLFFTRKDFSDHVNVAVARSELVHDNLAHWLAASPEPNGFFKTSLTRNWKPVGDQVATLTTQSRLIYVFAVGYDKTKDKKYLEAVKSGANFLLKAFTNPTSGWYGSVGPDGGVINAAPDRTGSANVIFGLTEAYRVTGDKRYLDAAIKTWQTDGAKMMFDARLRTPELNPVPPVDGVTFNQTSLMNLFNGMLALHQITHSQAVWQDIETLARFVFKDLYNRGGGYIPERFDSNWKPLPEKDGGNVDLGHQFEWAYLISRAVDLGLPRSYLTPADELIDHALKVGYDPGEGGIYSTASYTSGEVTDRRKTTAAQCELLSALMTYAEMNDRKDFWPKFDQTWRLVHQKFIDNTYGGWYGEETAPSKLTDVVPPKATDGKIGYHVTAMYAEALRLAKLTR